MSTDRNVVSGNSWSRAAALLQLLAPSWKRRFRRWTGRAVDAGNEAPRLPVPNDRSSQEAASTPHSAANTVQNHWDQSASDEFLRDMTRRSWSGIPQTHSNHNFLITGRRDYHWIRYMRDRYFPDGFAGDTLSLGCGEGHVDRLCKNEGFQFRSFTGIDISPASVKKAQELANDMSLSPKTRYFVADLNNFSLPRQSYDFIYFFQSLHHVEALEKLLFSCAQALRPGGLMMVNEFVGPTRFQWTPEQLRMADEIVNRLPPDLRVDLLNGDGTTLKTKCVAFTVAQMIQGDPSEAVRSADIEPVMRDYFNIVEEKNWGGTLNYLIFENIAGNFNPKNPLHESIVELLIHHENTLIANGVIPSNFKHYVVRPKGWITRQFNFRRYQARVIRWRARRKARHLINKMSRS